MYAIFRAFCFVIMPVVALSQGASSDFVLDLSSIALKSQVEVQTILGEPSMSEVFTPTGVSCSCKKVYYKEKQIAIVYINGEADWLWVYRPTKVSNVRSTRIVALHQFENFRFIKFKTIKNQVCCENSL